MKNSTLNRMVFMSLMVVITAMGLGKVVLPLYTDKSVETQAQLVEDKAISPSEIDILTAQSMEPQVTTWDTEWLPDELIPSAEAAADMALEEEQDNRAENAAKVIEMREKQRQLSSREKMLDEREGEIAKAEKRAQDKIKQLEQLETRIQAILDEEKSIKDKKIKRLTAVYEGMKAERAAPVIAQMELKIVVKIFSRMSEKQVGKILSFLEPRKAVVISQALTKRIATVSK